jgi:transposase
VVLRESRIISIAYGRGSTRDRKRDLPSPLDAQQRIAELEAELGVAYARIAEQDVRIATQDARIAALTKQVELLLEKLGQNSSNSHRPPSSDPPGAGPRRTPKGKKRKRGGQPGHRGNFRELLPAAQVDKVVDLYPPQCENCWVALPKTVDPEALRYQYTEVPPLRPHTTEHRRHEVECACGHKTRALYDAAVIPSSPFGPRLMSLVGLFTGVYHISRRQTVQLLGDVLGVRLSLGAVSAIEARVSTALALAVTEVWEHVEHASVKHTDGTSWLQAGVVMCLWTIASATATVFKVLADGSKSTLAPLYGKLTGILVSDRAKALNFWAMERRQICWAHLVRKFILFSERAGPTKTFGKELLDYTAVLFDYYHGYRDGKVSKDAFVALMAPVRVQFEALLERAVAANIERMSGSCADMLLHKQALWTFIECADVQPTNNHAERELRAFVLWRRRSFGTQSARGNEYAERVMTVAHTARKQKKNILAFLIDCMRAQRDRTGVPSLFSAPTTSCSATT